MPVSIELRQTRTVETDELFRVRTEVLVATGIIPEIFVTRTEDDAFLHVALVDELASLYKTKQEAIDNQEEQYLSYLAIADYAAIETAVSGAEHIRLRVQHLVVTYDNYTTTFEGQDEYTITSETP